MSESLNRLLAELHAHREATWDAAALKVNIDQRATLAREAVSRKFVAPGDRVAPFGLPNVEGGVLEFADLTARGPAVLIFFRFAGCPACNIALPYYNRQLAPRLAALGVPLVGVSPQTPEKLVEIKRRHALDFLIATDVDNALGRRFGILYEFDEPSKQAALAAGRPIGDVTGTGTWELPMPAVIVIDSDHIVRFADVSPDWLKRSEAPDVIAAVEAVLSAASKAA
jgi:peroxiredoxin